MEISILFFGTLSLKCFIRISAPAASWVPRSPARAGLEQAAARSRCSCCSCCSRTFKKALYLQLHVIAMTCILCGVLSTSRSGVAVTSTSQTGRTQSTVSARTLVDYAVMYNLNLLSLPSERVLFCAVSHKKMCFKGFANNLVFTFPPTRCNLIYFSFAGDSCIDTSNFQGGDLLYNYVKQQQYSTSTFNPFLCAVDL